MGRRGRARLVSPCCVPGCVSWGLCVHYFYFLLSRPLQRLVLRVDAWAVWRAGHALALLVCRRRAFEEERNEVQCSPLLCLLLVLRLTRGHVSCCSRLCLTLSATSWGSYLASHFLYLSSGVFFTWSRDVWGICLSTGGETRGELTGVGGGVFHQAW